MLYMRREKDRERLLSKAGACGHLLQSAEVEQLRGFTVDSLFRSLLACDQKAEVVNWLQAEVSKRVSQEAAEGRRKWRSWAQSSV
eukprot:9196789-Pyramimonas_sp.AAC.1